MFSKFHWGHGIAIFYIIFVATLVTVLIASFGVDHSLVVDDYYAQDINYQQQFDKTKNLIAAADNKVVINNLSGENKINIDFQTDGAVQGKVNFYRPSDKTQDFAVDLNAKSNMISTQDLLKGRWVLKIEWNESQNGYYTERPIYIQ